LHALLEFGFELQLDELFNRLWASIRGVIARIYIEFIVQACLVLVVIYD